MTAMHPGETFTLPSGPIFDAEVIRNGADKPFSPATFARIKAIFEAPRPEPIHRSDTGATA